MPPHQPGMAMYIDHLAIWDPRHLAYQIGGTITLTTSFLDHKGVLGTTYTSSGPYQGSQCSSTHQDTSGPYIHVPSPGRRHGNMTLQIGGGFRCRYRYIVGHDTHDVRIIVSS